MPHPADYLSYLAGVSLRAIALASVAWLALLVFRVRAASARHAVWTVVTIAMLALAIVSSALPSIPLRVLQAPVVATGPADSFPHALPQALPAVLPSPELSMSTILLWAYTAGVAILLGRFLIGYLFTRRLVRSSASIPGSRHLRESSRISVPMAVGGWSPAILLPAGWRAWDAAKVRAVLAHEEAHLRRWDWGIGILARINCCVFWFHPLSWRLKHQLATLAEHACDDAALAEVQDRQAYATALLDMAAAVKSSNGRVVWGAVPMAKNGSIQARIDQILDEKRQLSRVFGPFRWAALAVCSLPLAYFVSSAQLAPAQDRNSPYFRWMDEEVRWIATDYDRVTFTLLRTDEERQKFIEQFWLRRDPTPGTPANEYKEEHYRRIAYANDHFTEAVPGWNTDRGRIYILYGPPDTLDAYGAAGATPPYESWKYRYVQGLGNDVVLEFSDTNKTGRYQLKRP
jgi:GWxTD domain-containing protein